MTCLKYLCLEAELSSLFSGKEWDFYCILWLIATAGITFLVVMGACSLETCKNYSSSDMHFFVLNNKFHWWKVLKTNTRDTRVDDIQIVLNELKQNFAISKSIVKIRKPKCARNNIEDWPHLWETWELCIKGICNLIFIQVNDTNCSIYFSCAIEVQYD